MSQRKPLPFPYELPINESSIRAVVFNVGNVRIFWSHFLEGKERNQKDSNREKRTTAVLAQNIGVFHKAGEGTAPG